MVLTLRSCPHASSELFNVLRRTSETTVGVFAISFRTWEARVSVFTTLGRIVEVVTFLFVPSSLWDGKVSSFLY
jgi:hypothetical protein